MSAFAGYVRFDHQDPPPRTAARLQQSLNGPGLAPARTCRAAGGVFVVRQRILAPEDRHERQPSTGASGAVSMFDGRIDNRGELAEALGLGNILALPDGEIARAAYEKWADEAPSRLIGDFAWAVWNTAERRLMLSRYHGYERALYYHEGEGFLAFSTAYRPLLSLPDVPREIDEIAIADMLLVTLSEGEGSLYRGISWVPPASCIVAAHTGTRSRRFWEPQAGRVTVPQDDGAVVEAGRALFDQAVKARLRIEGPVVTSVSGGLDSSAVAATAARLATPAPVHAICMVPAPGASVAQDVQRYADERPLVEELAARHPNLRTEYLSLSEPGLFEADWARTFAEVGAPSFSPLNGSWFVPALQRAAALGQGTMLFGTWGNMVVSGNGYERLPALAADRAWMTFAREVVGVARSGVPNRWDVVRQALAAAAPNIATAYRRIKRPGGPSMADSAGGMLSGDFVRAAGLAGRWAKLGIAGLDPWHPDARLINIRYMMMRARPMMDTRAGLRQMIGVTTSDVFSDRPLIDFCLSLPPDQFMRAGEGRRLARRLFADRLPLAILSNQSRGQQSADWHARLTPMRAHIADEIDRLERSPLATRILDMKRMRRALDSWPTDPEEAARTRWLQRNGLFRALHVGRFLSWVEGGNH